METAKENIDALKRAVKLAQEKQAEEKAQCQKLEKDMAEFDNNKDGKIDELRVCLEQRPSF